MDLFAVPGVDSSQAQQPSQQHGYGSTQHYRGGRSGRGGRGHLGRERNWPGRCAMAYLVSVVDEYSSYGLVFQVKTKAPVPDLLRDAIRWFRQQSGNRDAVHVVHSDRGGEHV